MGQKTARDGSGPPLPGYPGLRTSSGQPDWSGSCQFRKWVAERKSRPNRLCENSDVELSRRTFVSTATNKKITVLASAIERREERKQFCASSARGRFHTACEGGSHFKPGNRGSASHQCWLCFLPKGHEARTGDADPHHGTGRRHGYAVSITNGPSPVAPSSCHPSSGHRRNRPAPAREPTLLRRALA